MRTTFTNFQISPKVQTINNDKNSNNIKTSASVQFKGVQYSEPAIYTANIIPIFKNPIIHLQQHLVHDGYNMDDIKTWDIYSTPMSNDAKAGAKAFEKDYQKYIMRAQSVDPPHKVKKSGDDVAAMLRVYNRLKDDFENEDTKKYSAAFKDLGKMMEEKLGVQVPEGKPVQDLILETLSYTNKYNEPIVYELLDDENFNNINIAQAISEIQTKEDSEAALDALHFAREQGYNKDFSMPLSIILSSTTPQNLPVVKKAVQEQEFLINTKGFAPKKLRQFLHTFDYLAVTYMKDDLVTLKDVNEILDEKEQDDKKKCD